AYPPLAGEEVVETGDQLIAEERRAVGIGLAYVAAVDEVGAGSPGVADGEVPPLVADLDPPGRPLVAEGAVTQRLDAGGRQRAAVAPDLLWHQRPAEVERVVHQVGTDQATGVGDARR